MRRSISPEKIRRDLVNQVKGRVISNPVVRYCYATDASIFRIIPSVVVQPLNPEDIAKVLVYANEYSLPVTARGAGTGLAGESLTTGIVLDCSVFLNRIEEINPDKRLVRLQPGVIPDLLNQTLAVNKLHFGPDPSTSNRCTIGGMIANNAAGAHSLKYGMTNRWVKSLDVFLSDGSSAHLTNEQLGSTNIRKKLEDPALEGQIYREMIPLLLENQQKIAEAYPDLPRNRHGYLLKDAFNNNQIDLTRLICSSEGTLGIIWQAEIELSPVALGKALLCLAFHDRLEAADATSFLLQFLPAAIELIDEYCLDLVRSKPEYQALLTEKTKSLLLVEFQADNDLLAFDLAANARNEALKALRVADYWLPKDKANTQLFWNMRKQISAMLNKMPGEQQPIPIIEDVCVHPKKLRQYLLGVDQILAKHNLKYLAFGHAGDGVLHVRPFLNRHDPELGEWLPDVCSDIYDMALELGGSISGEHGDGLLRAPFISRQYGSLFEVFKKIKRTFDPNDILNPGKKTTCKDFSAWKTALRFSPILYKNTSIKLNWPDNHLARQVEACNGCGACRDISISDHFCPAFQAFGHEMASARARANVMHGVLTGELSGDDLISLSEVTQYCLNCRKCETYCPAAVSAADCNCELRAESFSKLSIIAQSKLISKTEKLLPLIIPFTAIANYFLKQAWLRQLLPLIGLAKERKPPLFSGLAMKRNIIAAGLKSESRKTGIKAVYFADMASYYFKRDIADALILIMQHNQIDLILPRQKTSGVVPMTYGNVKDARKLAIYNLEHLLPYAQAGYQIICSEPSAALMLKEEYPLLTSDEKYAPVFKATVEACTFLLQLKEKGDLCLAYQSLPLTLGYHQPCHLRLVDSTPNSLKLLTDIPNLKVRIISQSCCGIAGTFGMRQKYYQASMKIGSNLFQALSDPDIDYGLTECSACQMQMEHGVPDKKTLHPLEVLATAAGLTQI